MGRRQRKQITAIENKLNEVRGILEEALNSDYSYSGVCNKIRSAREILLGATGETGIMVDVEGINLSYTKVEEIDRLNDLVSGFIEWLNGSEETSGYYGRLQTSHGFNETDMANLWYEDSESAERNGELQKFAEGLTSLEGKVADKVTTRHSCSGYLNNEKAKKVVIKVVSALLILTILGGAIAGVTTLAVKYNQQKSYADDLKKDNDALTSQVGYYQSYFEQFTKLTEESKNAMVNFITEICGYNKEEVEKYSDAQLVSNYITASRGLIENYKEELKNKDLTIKEQLKEIERLQGALDKAYKLDDASKASIIWNLVYVYGENPMAINKLSDAELIRVFLSYELGKEYVEGGSSGSETGESNDKEPIEEKNDDVYAPGGFDDSGESYDREPEEEKNDDPYQMGEE